MITIQEIRQMISEETLKLNAIGYYPSKVTEIKVVNMQSFYAYVVYATGLLKVSSYYLDAPKDEIRATIMHELTHLVKESGRGHGKAWKEVAAKVSAAYPQYNIRRCGTNLAAGVNWPLRAVAHSASSPKRIYKVTCKECGQSWIRYRQSRLTQHPEYYHCPCGGKLTLEIN